METQQLSASVSLSVADILGMMLSIALPWILGTVLVRLILGKRNYPFTLYLGHGYLLGLFVATLLLHAWDSLDLAFNFYVMALTLAGLTAGIALADVSMHGRNLAVAGGSHDNQASLESWEKIACVLLIGLIGLRLASIGQEVWLRPIFGWDAWASWTPQTLQFYDNQSLSADLNTLKKSHGIFSNLVHLWSMLGASNTSTTFTGLPWLFAMLSLVCAVYGHLRTEKFSMPVSLLGGYFVASLPFLDLHITLVGFADFWLTLAFTLGILSITLYSNTGKSSLFILSILYAVFCAAIKQAGIGITAILMFCVIAQIFIQTARTRLKIIALAGLTVMLITVVTVFTTGFQASFNTPLIGQLTFGRDLIQVPGVVIKLKEYQSITFPVIESTLLFSSWHLLTYLFMGMAGYSAATRKWSLLAHPAVFAAFATLAYTWIYHSLSAPNAAYNHTGLSRSLMYVTPAMIYWVFLATRSISTSGKFLPAQKKFNS